MGFSGGIVCAEEVSEVPETPEAFNIVAVVEDEAISMKDVEDRMQLAIASSGLEATPEIKKRLLPQVIQMLVDEALYRQEAARESITVSAQDIEHAVATLEKENHIEPGHFYDFIKQKGIDKIAFTNQLKSQLLWKKIVSRKVTPNIVVTESEVEEKMENISSLSGMAEIHLAEILLSVDSPEREKEVSELAEKLQKEIQGGADFAAIAKEFSRSNTAERGGEIGWVQTDQLHNTLQSVVSGLSVGQVSNPVRTPEGYHLLFLKDKRALVASAPEETEIGFRQIYIPLKDSLSPQQKTEVVEGLKKVKQDVKDCQEFEVLAKKVHSAVPPTMVMSQLKDMNAKIKETITALPIGKSSPVIQSGKGLHVFMVCERIEAGTSFAKREKLQDMLFDMKLSLQARRFMRDLRRNAFIDVRI